MKFECLKAFDDRLSVVATLVQVKRVLFGLVYLFQRLCKIFCWCWSQHCPSRRQEGWTAVWSDDCGWMLAFVMLLPAWKKQTLPLRGSTFSTLLDAAWHAVAIHLLISDFFQTLVPSMTSLCIAHNVPRSAYYACTVYIRTMYYYEVRIHTYTRIRVHVYVRRLSTQNHCLSQWY